MSCPFSSFMGGTAAPHPVPNDSTLTGTEQLSQTKSASPSCSPPFSTYNSPNGPIPIPIPITIPVSESESESVYVPPPDFPAAGCPMMNATGETPLLTSMPTTAFLNIFPDAVLLVDPNRRIVVCNDAVCRLFGYPLSSLIGQAIEKLVPPKVQAYHGSLADRVFEDMIPREMANRKPVHGRHSSGRLFPATVQLIPCLLQLSPAEEPKKVVWCIARDMSGYNKAMHDRQQAEQHSALVGKFLRLLNHEVRTSIHAITNAMITLSHELQEISVKPPSLPLLEVGVQQMSTLLTNMIDLRNLQENNMIQHHCFFQPSSVLSLLKDHTAALWLRKKQQLLLHCDSSIPAVYGDPHLVAKCLTPLIENSIKYSSDGACILISCTMHHDSISKIEHITGNTTPTIQLSPRRLRDETPSQTSDESGSGISDSAGGAGGSHGSTGSSSASNPTRQIQSTSVSLTSYARTPRIRSRDTPRIHTRQNSMDVGTSAIAAGLSPTPIPHSSPSPKISTIRSISHGKRKASKSGSPVETPSSPTIIRRERKRMIPLTSTPLQMELVRGRKSICEDDEMDMMTQPKPAPSTAPSLHSIPTITPSQPAAIPSESTSNQDGEDDGIDVHLVFRVSDCGPGLSQESLYSMAAGFFQVDASSTRNTAGGVGIGINLSKLAAESLHADLQVWSAPHTQPMTVPVDTVNENGKINGSTSPASSIPSTSPTSPTSNISATSPTHSFTYRDHAACDSDMICDRCAHTFQSMCSTCFTLTVPYIAFPNMVLDESMEPTVSISAPLSERSIPHPTVLNPQIQHDIIQSPHDHDRIHIQPIIPNGTSYHPSSHTTPSPSPSPPSSPSASSPQLTTASIPSSKIHTTATPALLHMPPLPITPIPTPVTTTTTSSSSSLHTFNTVRQSTTTTPSSTHITLHTSTSPVSMDIDINGSTPHTSSITSTIPIPSVESSRPPQRPVGGNQNTVFNPKLKPHVLKKMASNDTKQARSEFKILIVEDNLINVKVIRQCLVKRGFNTITVAENGQIALDIIEARWRESELAYQSTSSTKILPTSIEQFVTPFPFQVILMDCEMPIMDGYTCTARLRDRGVKCPIVALTANATLDAQKLCASAGMDLYLTKPLCAEDLLFALASLSPFSMYPSHRCPYALMAHFASTRQHAAIAMQLET